MNIFIRADASVRIGAGHIFRCLTLARACRNRGADVRFICLESAGNLIDYVEKFGFRVYRLDYGESYDEMRDITATIKTLQEAGVPIDRLVVDHYSVGVTWESELRQSCEKLMVIDDIARAHVCGLLLDPNYYRSPESRYEGKVPSGTKLLLGPEYALIREAFVKQGAARRRRRVGDRRALLFFGGSDADDWTTRVLRILTHPRFRDLQLDVVVGAGNPHRERVQRMCERRPGTAYYCQIDHMDQLMGEADFSIGAGGTATWERFAAGLPSIVIAIADNQRDGARELERTGAIDYLGWHEEVTDTAIGQACMRLMHSPMRQREMRQKGFGVMGLNLNIRGPAELVVDQLMEV